MGGKWWSKKASEWHRGIRDIRRTPNLFRGPDIGMEYAPRDETRRSTAPSALAGPESIIHNSLLLCGIIAWPSVKDFNWTSTTLL